ncbi:MAG: CooT family nickel-binding protein [Oscillospiraceae bacterium]|nr:CooT family nickel-binding protein [Oscillospiraceae bacterium]
MCLSTAYSNEKSPEHLIAKNIQFMRFEEGGVILTDLLDNETRVPGAVKSIDLVNGVVIIDTEVA